MDRSNRFRLKFLYDANIRSPSILHKMTNIPLSTIDRNLRRFRENISYDRRPGQGRPRKLSGQDCRRIAAIALKSPKVSVKMISMKLNYPKVTPQTIRNYFKLMEIRKVVPKRIPMITKASMAKRLSWAKKTS